MKKGYTLYVDEELIEKLEKEKKETGVSPSWRVNDMIKKYLENQKRK